MIPGLDGTEDQIHLAKTLYDVGVCLAKVSEEIDSDDE
jgi:hypothetical protein